MNRRKFLRNSATATTLPILLGGFPIHTLARSTTLESLVGLAEHSDRVLVLIQLNGGNDGLNTVIPLDQYATLAPARSQVLIPESQVLNLSPETGLHPAMAGMQTLYQQDKLAVVQSVGYPDPNFSHFRSIDIWTTASPADEVYQTGWMGRYLESLHGSYPVGYPNANFPDPLALTIGSVVSNTCQGSTSSLGLAIRDPDEFSQLLTGNTGPVPNTPYGHELGFLRQTMLQTNQYIQSIQTAANNATNLSPLYPAPRQNRLADQLKIVAQLIHGGLQTPFYIVNLGGFDTHANQVLQNNPTQGFHANLLGYLSEAIMAFQDDMRLMGHEDRVLGMTFSEFGRRIKANASFGTDHGAAAPLFLFGTQVNSQLFGTNPIIPAGVDVRASLPMQFDFRSVYGSVLQDWFCVDESAVKQLLFPDYQHLSLLNGSLSCQEPVPTSIDEPLVEGLLGQNYPNPFQQQTQIPFKSLGGRVSLTLFDLRGSSLGTLTDQVYAPGDHTITLNGHDLSAGLYYVRMQQGNQQALISMEKR